MNKKNEKKISDGSQVLNLNAYQYILDNVDIPYTNSINLNQWKFKGLSINFDTILRIERNHPEWSKKIKLNLLNFSKILLLKSIESIKSEVLIRYRFDCIVKTLTFLAEHDTQYLTQKDLQDYFIFQLLHSIYNNRVEKRLTPFCYQNFSSGISIKEWVNIQRTCKLPPIGFKLAYSETIQIKALKKAFELVSDGDLTYRDWQEGGSFNYLTLDFGRYYVDHCVSFFEQHVYLAIALKLTLNEAANIAKEAGLLVNQTNFKSYVMLVIGNFLVGRKTSDLTLRTRAKHSQNWFNTIEKSALQALKKNIRLLSILQELTQLESIKDFISHSKLDVINDNQLESVKYLVQSRWFLLSKKSALLSPSIESLRKTEEHILNKHLNIDLNSFNKQVDTKYNSLKKKCNITLPDVAFFKAIGIEEKSTQSTFINNFLRFVEYAGIIKFVALTGWRESEYGFSINDVGVFKNEDIIDQDIAPIRFEVKWMVPKTSGKSKLNREINRSSYETIIFLSQLTSKVEPELFTPALYSYNSLAKHPSLSGEFIKRTVGKLWIHFKNYYKPFQKLILLEELNLINTKATLGSLELLRKEKLTTLYFNESWSKLERDPLLRIAYQRVNSEYDRVSFFLNKHLRQGLAWTYKEGTLNSTQTKLLDTYLSQKTKDAIQNLTSKEQLTPYVTKEITNELISGCLYPTPHAFRHMWAEAVYRRFDGDAGWMIRSNFKHISQTMWLSYIRNKNNRRQHDMVKRNVVSSLLHNFILKKGAGYAGSTETILRRMFLSTKVISINEINNSLDEFIDIEIKDIKSNPWGYCLLRTRSQDKAKCADGGFPQRHNASPSLCLGCTHNLTQLGNIEGILLGISNDLKVIQNSQVPIAFRHASFNTVKNALKHLKKLSADIEIIEEIENTLTFARNNL